MADFVSPELERMAAIAKATDPRLTEREEVLASILYAAHYFSTLITQKAAGKEKLRIIREFGKHLDYYLERQRQEWGK